MTQSPLLRLWTYAEAYRPRILLATFVSVLNKVFDLAPPFLIGVAVDTVVAQKDSILSSLFGLTDVMTQLWVLAAITFFVWGMESVTDYIDQILWRNLAQSLQHDLRVETYGHVQGLEMAYFEDKSTGGLMSVLNDDVNQLERFLDVGANDVLQLLATVVLLGIYFFVVAPGVAWLAFLPIPVIVWGSLRFQRQMAPRYAEVREQVGLLNGQLANNLSGIATIKSFTAEGLEEKRVSGGSDVYRLKKPRGDSLFVAVRAAHPHGDRLGLYGDARVRRLSDGEWRDWRGCLQHARFHDAAVAVAADAPRANPRPVPAGDGLVAAGVRFARYQG